MLLLLSFFSWYHFKLIRFTAVHNFKKPDDERALHLMNRCASAIMHDFPEMVLAYGQSDEYSFVLKRDARVYQRRECKLVSVVASLFASNYVFWWKDYFGDTPLQYPP